MIYRTVVKNWALILLMALITLMPLSTQDQSLFVIASGQQSKEEIIEQTPLEDIGKEKLSKELLLEEDSMSEEELRRDIGLDQLDEDATLEEKLDVILESEYLQGTITGISIRQAGTGETLYSQFDDIRLRPASNMKIITAAAALETLGADYQFSTDVLTNGTLRGKVLQGDMYLRGKGDPTLLKEDFDQLAKDLKDRGIHKVKGDLIGDDSWHDDVHLSRDLQWSDEPYYYGSQVSALTVSPNEDYDTGTVIVEVYPGANVGDQAEVKVIPKTDHMEVVNNTKTVGASETRNITIDREHGSNKLMIEGQIPLEGSHVRVWRSVWDPTTFALDIFKKSLEEQGITFIGQSKITTGITPEHATLLTSKQSMTLDEILIPFMKLSNNGHGEMLTKEMGRVVHGEGSWDKGLQVVIDVMDDLGVNTETIILRDGSGISDKTLIPASELSELLYNVQNKSWFPILEESLPVAGEDDRMVGGTLRNRMTGDSTKGNVKAKTGTITGASTLSGYVTSKDGEKLIFSFMMNNYVEGSMTQIQDLLATVLAEHTFE